MTKLIKTNLLSFVIILQIYAKVIFSSDSFFQQVVFYSLVAICLFYILTSSKSINEIIVAIFSFILYVYFGNSLLIKLVLILLAVKNEDIVYLIKCHVFYALVLYLSTIYFKFGSVDLVGTFYRDGPNSSIRDTMGFDNPNKPFLYFSTIIYSALFLIKDKSNSLKFTVILMLLSWVIYVYDKTKSYTGLFVYVSLLLVYLLHSYYNLIRVIIEKLVLVFVPMLPILLIGVSVFVPLYYHDNTLANAILTGRPKYWYYYLSEIPYTNYIFGGKVEYQGALDNSFIQLIGGGGVFLISMFWMHYSKTFKRIQKMGDQSLCIILIFVFIYATSETFFFEPGLNITLYWLTYYSRNLNCENTRHSS